MYKTVLLIILLLTGISLRAQLNIGGKPMSFSTETAAQIKGKMPVFKMPDVDLKKIKAEDLQNKDKAQPWRFGINIKVDISVLEDAQLTTLKNGDRIYQLELYAPDAQTINIAFDNFYLPEKSKLFIYSADRKMILGAFTALNNTPSYSFASELLKGDRMIIEYYQPADIQDSAMLHIFNLTHGYRSLSADMRDYGESGYCNINVNCPEGAGWENEIRSACMLVTGLNGFCSGALVNNTAEDETPYILTADHCYKEPEYILFRFNWQTPDCEDSDESPYYQSLTGASLIARNDASDFCLYKLNDIPPLDYNVYYAGWNRSDNPAESAVCIHHPSGDVKKISFDEDAPYSTSYEPSPYVANSHWKIGQWEAGTTEGGSSGSPLFDDNHLIIGQLHGGYASCGSLTADYFGKFSYSWDYESEAEKQLKKWLDPIAANAEKLEGYDPSLPKDERDIRIVSVRYPHEHVAANKHILPEFTLYNKGLDEVLSFTLRIFNDDIESDAFHWTGHLPSTELLTIKTNSDFIPAEGTHNLRFYISEINGAEDQFSVNDSLTFNYEAHKIIYFEDFEHANFWELSGEFEISTPENAGTNAPENAYSGLHILGTDLSGLGDKPGNYEPNLSEDACTALSPVIDCRNFKDVWVTYRHRSSFEGVKQDSASFSIINPDSVSNIWSNGRGELVENEWSSSMFNVSDIAGGLRTKLKFALGKTNETVEYCGWNIDDIAVFGNEVSAPQLNVQGISLYPNPTSGCLNIELADEPVSDILIKITDISGRELSGFLISKNEFILVGDAQKYWLKQLNLDNMPAGIYLMFVSGTGLSLSSKIILSK